jgi:hypothetical protein
MKNQESVVCILDADDALIGRNVLKNLIEKYTFFEADVVVGKMFRTDKLHAHYKYVPNFVNPRLTGGNVWQHLRSFRKYLFDSLSFEDLKISAFPDSNMDLHESNRFSNRRKFPEHCWDFAYMVPIVEMSQSPMIINHFNVLHDRTTVNTPEIKAIKEAEIGEILNKPAKCIDDIIYGRRTFSPNLKKIEMDITYDCNLSCRSCNRSSPQAPSKNGMKIEQIEAFIQESKTLNVKWELINILGGEPTLHPDFLSMIKILLNDYVDAFSPATILQVTSNGFGEVVQQTLRKLPKHPQLIVDRGSFKEGTDVSYFAPFNAAPADNQDSDHHEYHKGCWITSYCGIGLNQFGYFACGVAGGIERILDLGHGKKSLSQVDESIAEHLEKYCKFCGNFSASEVNKGNFIPRYEMAATRKPAITKTWKNAYKKYNAESKSRTSSSSAKRRN